MATAAVLHALDPHAVNNADCHGFTENVARNIIELELELNALVSAAGRGLEHGLIASPNRERDEHDREGHPEAIEPREESIPHNVQHRNHFYLDDDHDDASSVDSLCDHYESLSDPGHYAEFSLRTRRCAPLNSICMLCP